ncbi:MAG: DUF1667 domain-containing protein [Oscillospiraceae bacterium]|nr:DUF1667 domain-containing protein [Oscillospiraceae bacterium]
MEKKLTCIVCPLGCQLTVQLNGREVVKVEGNTCPRGAEYAKNECTNPQRTVTSTIRCENGGLVSVKTDRPIPKEKMTECMQLINKAVVKRPVAIGDVILSDVFGSNIVATQNKP